MEEKLLLKFSIDDIPMELYLEQNGYCIRGCDEEFGYEIPVSNEQINMFDEILTDFSHKIAEDIRISRGEKV